jgi:hypothetical protein
MQGVIGIRGDGQGWGGTFESVAHGRLMLGPSNQDVHGGHHPGSAQRAADGGDIEVQVPEVLGRETTALEFDDNEPVGRNAIEQQVI